MSCIETPRCENADKVIDDDCNVRNSAINQSIYTKCKIMQRAKLCNVQNSAKNYFSFFLGPGPVPVRSLFAHCTAQCVVHILHQMGGLLGNPSPLHSILLGNLSGLGG